MALEIEAKIKVETHDLIRARLSEVGATLLHRHLETNTFFDTPARTLRAADQGLRIRAAYDLDTHATLALITHKGPRQPGPFKTRDETELSISDPAAAANLFRSLGYLPTLSFEKRRDSYRLHDCQIELDTLPILGRFIEIEGPSESSLHTVRSLLQLADNPLVSSGYSNLLASLDLPQSTFRFDPLDGQRPPDPPAI